MKKFQVALVGCALFSLLIACAPKPSDEIVDLSKARARLSLVDGSPISSDDYDDVNPILIRGPNEQLILVFESDRPCDEGCSGYNIFVTESVEAFDPTDPFYIPAFYEPVPLTAFGSPLNPPNSGRYFFQATLQQGAIVFLIDVGGGIGIATLPPSFSSGVLSGYPSLVANTNFSGDTLIHADFRTSRMITMDSAGDLYISRYNDPTDTGVSVFNDDLKATSGASKVVPGISGFTDALLYESGGYLAYGQYDTAGDEMSAFNDALDREELELSYVSTMQQYLFFADLLVFSAGEYGDQHDLYVVTSHTLDQLWYQSAEYGGQFEYDDLFNIYVTSPTSTGSFGGIAGADSICNNDSGQPDINVYYKAMLVDNAGTRRASSTGAFVGDGQVDWVLQPLTTYQQGSWGDVIGTTSSASLFTTITTGSIFAGPVTVWTGFIGPSDWRSAASNHCSNWGSTVGTGIVGLANGALGPVMNNTTTACNGGGGSASLYCVEQP
ncbi:MAG: DUF1554 domain-containing protein [Turneriella sp.]|nr:DUF1554 domain-containing protein [Turneriella sp.]